MESANMVKVTFRVSPEDRERMQVRAAARGITVGEYVRGVVCADLVDGVPDRTRQWFREAMREELRAAEELRGSDDDARADEALDRINARVEDMLAQVLDAAGAALAAATVAACGGAKVYDRDQVARAARDVGRAAALGGDFALDLEDAGV